VLTIERVTANANEYVFILNIVIVFYLIKRKNKYRIYRLELLDLEPLDWLELELLELLDEPLDEPLDELPELELLRGAEYDPLLLLLLDEEELRGELELRVEDCDEEDRFVLEPVELGRLL